ncbi:MAG: phenylalanine--tRNA ligase subunit alpha [Puniceicoccaceae bacterium]
MDEELKQLLAKARADFEVVNSAPELEQAKARVMGPRGTFTEIRKQIASVPKEDRPIFGKLINEAKVELEGLIAAVGDRLERARLAEKVGPPIDPSLPSIGGEGGGAHPLTTVRERILEIFRKIGFVVADGTEVETEYYCFDALNTPPEHPARDLHDTYYLDAGARFGNVSKRADERYLLRTHTSSVQIRTMLESRPPVRIMAPGRCFRRDTADATHSANFHQIEGLLVDEGVTVMDLKAVLDYFFRELLGSDAKTRFRPHFFPYTEPSFEVDLSSKHLGKVGADWIEIMGCGMVDPAVFDEVGYDSSQYTGYAFGMGIERIAMILYGIDDIRYFYRNDARFLRQFV